MIVWQIPKKKARIELTKEGWLVYIKTHSWQFNSLAECLCYLAGKGVIEYDQIDFLIRATWERYE